MIQSAKQCLKSFFVPLPLIVAMMLPRAVLPRVTIGALLRGGWTKLMLLAFVNLFIALLVVSLGIYSIGGI